MLQNFKNATLHFESNVYLSKFYIYLDSTSVLESELHTHHPLIQNFYKSSIPFVGANNSDHRLNRELGTLMIYIHYFFFPYTDKVARAIPAAAAIHTKLL